MDPSPSKLPRSSTLCSSVCWYPDARSSETSIVANPVELDQLVVNMSGQSGKYKVNYLPFSWKKNYQFTALVFYKVKLGILDDPTFSFLCQIDCVYILASKNEIIPWVWNNSNCSYFAIFKMQINVDRRNIVIYVTWKYLQLSCSNLCSCHVQIFAVVVFKPLRLCTTCTDKLVFVVREIPLDHIL